MKIKKLLGIIAIPVGAVFLYACGPVETNQKDVALDENVDSWIYSGYFSEWGGCNNAIDDDGDGLRDSHDPDCHILGPMDDLSLAPFPIGHNYFPDISKDLPGGPGFDGDFRDPELIARWMRFLTEPDGNVAGIDPYDPGVNPEVVPLPAPLPEKVLMGTGAFGNNNNLSARALHAGYVDHGFLPPPPAAAAAAAANAPGGPKVENSYQQTARQFVSTSKSYMKTKMPRGIGSGYAGQGPFGRGAGSQGAVKAARTGNPDSSSSSR